MSDERTRFDLQPDQIPTAWFNIMPDIVKSGIEPLPPLSPQTKQPIGPGRSRAAVPDVADRPGGLDRRVDRHPGRGDRRLPAVEALARCSAPRGSSRRCRRRRTSTSSTRAARRRAATSPTPRSPQAYFNKEAGIRRIATETGAGQWGSSMALACQMFGLECDVYMVRASYDQKPYRRVFMETFGASVVASPSDKTNSGRAILEAHPDSTGSLGIAISEAVEDAATHDDTNYALGSVLGHVLLHQSVIGLEAQQQMEMAGERARRGRRLRRAAARTTPASPTRSWPASCAARRPTCASSRPSRRRARRSRRAGSPTTSATRRRSRRSCRCTRSATTSCRRRCTRAGCATTATRRRCRCSSKHGHMDAVAYTQNEIFEAGLLFAKTQGILPAPEANHAVKGAIDEAIAAREAGRGARDPVQPLRARALRHAGLRRLPGRAGFPTSSSTPPTRRPRSRTCPRCRSRSERIVALSRSSARRA